MNAQDYLGKTDKEVKQLFKLEASKNPDKYYATEVLKKEGFKRKTCESCGINFWTVNDTQKVCGDSSCCGGFSFFKDNPAKNKLDYIGVWTAFSKFFKQKGYTPIQRYPVVARWRKDTDFVQASIYDFQPYVVSGEIEPPANPLVVPQFCLRFNDTDNVGITGAHYTGFIMIGQHAFVPPKEWNQEKYFKDIYEWLTQGLGIPKNEITFHEDGWAGGGNFGPCMEFFSRGLELGNQVYMQYETTTQGIKELGLKVLDMGMGYERNAWFCKGSSTSYESTFPTVCKFMKEKTGIKVDEDLMQKFLPYAAYLNVDEVEDINLAWEKVGKEIGISGNELKSKIAPLAAMYSVAEHSRSLLVALSDGGLPSNVGGGYNLRVILRRALMFIENYCWDITLQDLAEQHAEYLKPLFPELTENLDSVKQILAVEIEKFEQTKQKTKSLVANLIKKEITTEILLEQYDSNGIAPELIVKEAKLLGKIVEVPEDFYNQVTELHEKKLNKNATKKETKIDVPNLFETKILYFDDYKITEFEAKVLWAKNDYVILDKTVFYPTSGGQLTDQGIIICNNKEYQVLEVIKQGPYVIHKILKNDLKEGDEVQGKINFERRKQLTQHHTSAHIVNAAAKRILGNHIWQAGAAKSLKKARLDITHFDSLTKEELQQIEDEANKIIKQNIPVYKKFMRRDLAEAEYGFVIYQGGAVPGKELRIVEIPGVDVEACGGTHLDLTGEAEQIKILKTTKVQDGVVRIEYAAGNAVHLYEQNDKELITKLNKLLDCKTENLPFRIEELFSKWKKGKKAVKKKKEFDVKELELTSKEIIEVSEDKLEETAIGKSCEILKTQQEHLLNTVKRFKEELDEFRDKINKGFD